MNNPKSQFKRVLPLSLCCALCVTAFARADFVGVKTVNRNDVAAACAAAGAPDLRVCNVFLQFDDNDRLLNLTTIGQTPITVSNGAPYFQHVFGGTTAPNCAFFPVFPSLECDSFVTIGRKCSNNPPGTCAGDGSVCEPAEGAPPCGDASDCIPNPLFGDNTVLSVDFNIEPNAISGGWFSVPFGQNHPIPFSHQGDAGTYPDFQVLVAQLSVPLGEGVSGVVTLFWKDLDTGLTVASVVPIECPAVGCTGDFDTNGVVDAADLAELLVAWGANPGHPADFNSDGQVDAADLAEFLAAWGPC